MKTASLALALGAVLALAWPGKSAWADGSATANIRSGDPSFDLLSDDVCGGDNPCEKGDAAKTAADGKDADEKSAEREPTAKPEPEAATPPAIANAGTDKPKEDAEGEGSEDEDGAEEVDEEDDEWDDGPYEDPLGFDDD